MPITTNIVSLNPAHGKVYLIQHYVIKFVSDLWQISGFLWVSSTTGNNTDHHDITEILLKVALNSIVRTITSCLIPTGICRIFLPAVQ
jgi:hypothetical protein